jgi:hypothetical protein
MPGFLVFDVIDLTVSDNTVKKGDSFDITVEYEGSGSIWDFLEWISDNIGPINAKAQFYAEGMGVGPQEYDLSTVSVPLITGGNPYSASVTIDTSAAGLNMTEGVYRIQCLVQVETSGIMGFFDGDLLVSVYE